MAGYGYHYRNHNPHDGFDPWETDSSNNFEQLLRPALDEFEGRRMIAGDTHQYPGTYFTKTETTIKCIRPFAVHKEWSPPRYKNCPSYGVVNNNLPPPLMPSNGCPPVVEKIPNKIQEEVSQPSVFDFGAPRAPYRLRIPVSAGSYDTNGNTEVSDYENERHKPITNTIKDKDSDHGDLKADKILKPAAPAKGVYGARPGHPTGSVPPSPHMLSEREQTFQPPSMIMAGRRERPGSNMVLSKPMNDIDTAVEYLKKVINTSSEEVPDGGSVVGDKKLKLPAPPERKPEVPRVF